MYLYKITKIHNINKKYKIHIIFKKRKQIIIPNSYIMQYM